MTLSISMENDALIEIARGNANGMTQQLKKHEAMKKEKER